jgi:hypothetical protein
MTDQLLLQSRIISIGDRIETPAGTGTVTSFSINVELDRSPFIPGGRDCRTYRSDTLFPITTRAQGGPGSLGRRTENHDANVRPVPTSRQMP